MAASRRLAASLVLTLASSTVVVPAHAEVVSDTASTAVAVAPADFDAAYAEWEAERASARAALDNVSADAEAAQAALRAAEAALANAESELAAAEQRVRDADAAVDQAQRDNRAAHDAELQRLAAARKDAENALADAQHKLPLAEEHLQERDREFREITEALEAKGNELAGLNGLVADMERTIGERTIERDDQTANRDYWANHRFTYSEYERLCSQAIIEMVNDYRVANGLAPLRSHIRYNTQAEGYSREMARLDIFKHSDMDKWGYSGENIAMRGPYIPETMTSDDWGQLAEAFFNSWRNSPGHNRNMLDSIYQGIGMGVSIDEKGIFRATTMFFIEDTELTNGNSYRQSPATTSAIASEYPYYRPTGVREILGKGDWVAPDDPNGAPVDNSKIRGGWLAQVSKIWGLEDSYDRRVDMTHLADPDKAAMFAAEVQRLNEEIASLEGTAAELSAQRAATDSEEAELRKAKDIAQAELNDAFSALEQTERAVADAQERLDDATDALDHAPVAPEPVPAHLEEEAVEARTSVTTKRDTVAALSTSRSERERELSESQEKLATARDELNNTLARKPQPPASQTPAEAQTPTDTGTPGAYNPTFNTRRTAAPAASNQPASTGPTGKTLASERPAVDDATLPETTTPDNDGSSTGAVIGVIVALLAVVGIVAALASSGSISLQF